MDIYDLICYGYREVGDRGVGLCSPLRKRSVVLCGLMVASCSFLEMSLLPLMLVPIMPFIGREVLYANKRSSLHIHILWIGLCSGAGILLGGNY